MEGIAEAIGDTPVVRIRSFDSPVPIFGKCEHLNPGGSIKDRLALALIEDGERRGLLKPGQTIIEATAGNTGLGLAMVAAAKGYPLVCVLPKKMSKDKVVALRATGAEVMVAENAPLDSPENFRQRARSIALERGWFLADQFRNPANVEVHYNTTGPEILKAFPEGIGAFVYGVGTGGTISGVGRYLKEKNPETLVVLADPVGSSLAGLVNHGEYGEDSKYLVEGIGSSRAPDILDLSVIDFAISISDEHSFQTALQLQRKEALYVGGSTGTYVAAALELAKTRSLKKPIVTVLADSWDRYVSQDWMAKAIT